jgi:hypothetical protein
MPTVFDSMRQTRDRAALEADKMIRIRREQGAIDQLRRDITTVETELSKAALGAYRAGELTHPAVVLICQQIDALEAQIGQRTARIEQIRLEQIATAPPQPGRSCQRCGTEVPISAAFCPGCGAPAPKLAPVERCVKCGGQLPSNAAFCPTCGTPRDAQPAGKRCAKCSAELPEDAAFCLECGTRVAVAAPPTIVVPEPSPPPAVTPPSPSPVAATPPAAADDFPAESAKTGRAAKKKTPATSEVEPQPVEHAPSAPPPVVETPAERRCPNCSAALTDDAVFCSDCGARP